MVLILLIYLIVGILALIILKKWHNPVTIFSFMWAAIIFLYLLKLLPYYDVSEATMWVLGLQAVCFAVGGLGGSLSRVQFRIGGTKLHERTEFRPVIVLLMCAVSIVVLLGDTAEIIRSLLRGMSFDDIAEEGLITENDATGIMVLVRIFILFPTVHCIPAIGAAELFFGKGKQRWLMAILSVVISVLYALQHGARYTLILLVTCYVVAYVVSGKKIRMNKLAKIATIVSCAFAIWFAFWLSESRGIEDIWMSLYKYFAAIPALMDQWIQRAADAGSLTYGATSTWGFTFPFVVLLRGVGFISGTPALLEEAYENIVGPETSTVIGNGVSLNAHVGPSYALFCDGGYLFVILGMLLYGYICGRAYKWAQENTDSRSHALSLFWLSLAVYSFVRFPFTSYNFGMALLMIYFVYSKKRRTAK